jgi:hypothetical protein
MKFFTHDWSLERDRIANGLEDRWGRHLEETILWKLVEGKEADYFTYSPRWLPRKVETEWVWSYVAVTWKRGCSTADWTTNLASITERERI